MALVKDILLKIALYALVVAAVDVALMAYVRHASHVDTAYISRFYTTPANSAGDQGPRRQGVITDER